MNNKLNPRAKIGDVVIVKDYDEQWIVFKAFYLDENAWEYCVTDTAHQFLNVLHARQDTQTISDKDILKNLTTNQDYS